MLSMVFWSVLGIAPTDPGAFTGVTATLVMSRNTLTLSQQYIICSNYLDA
jgi:hypothetical protein